MTFFPRSLLVFALLIVVTMGVGLSARARARDLGPSRPADVAPAVAPTPASPGAVADSRPLHEVHWQGIEAIPLTPKLRRELGRVGGGSAVPDGVVIDQVAAPADTQGFAGGDVIVSVAGVATPDLPALLAAADGVREQPTAVVELNRQGQPMTGVLSAPRLGTANGETPPAIPPDAIPPHGCANAHAALLHLDTLGPCQQCHLIRGGNQPPTDLVQLIPEPSPPPGAPIDPACLPNL